MKKLKFAKKKKLSVSKIKKKAWDMFSKWIRLKDADKDGYVTCYTCGKRSLWNRGMQAGHGIPGRNNSVLFDTDVVRVQCVGCNYFGHGQYKIFTNKLIEELGSERFSNILVADALPKKMTAVDYQAIYEAYRDLVKELEAL